MTKARFHNALRVLLNIDKHEFVGAGGDPADWLKFRNTPHMYFIVCSDAVAAGLYAIIESRQAEEWQPISTAPRTAKDFSGGAKDFIGWCPDPTAQHGGDRRVCWWEPGMKDGRGCWWGDRDLEEHPTLWQPLPARPAVPRQPAATPIQHAH